MSPSTGVDFPLGDHALVGVVDRPAAVKVDNVGVGVGDALPGLGPGDPIRRVGLGRSPQFPDEVAGVGDPIQPVQIGAAVDEVQEHRGVDETREQPQRIQFVRDVAQCVRSGPVGPLAVERHTRLQELRRVHRVGRLDERLRSVVPKRDRCRPDPVAHPDVDLAGDDLLDGGDRRERDVDPGGVLLPADDGAVRQTGI